MIRSACTILSRRLAPVALLVLLPLLPAVLARTPAVPRVTGSYATENGVRVLRLWGTTRERGFAHGYLLGDEILAGMRKELGRILRGRPGLYEGVLVPLVRSGFRFSKDEEAELTGLLDGLRAKVPAGKRKVEVLSREPNLTDLKVLNTYGDWAQLGCSSAALWGDKTADGKAAVVRNFDFPDLDLLVSGQHVRIVAPAPGSKEKGWVGVCHPGSVGALTVLSEDGVFVSIHDVHVKPAALDYLQGNVPRLLAIKRIAAEIGAKGAVEAAAEKCRSWKTLYGNNFMVATRAPGGGLPAGVIEYDTRDSKGRGVTLRASGSRKGERLPYVVCTNHHRRRAKGRCGRYRALTKGCENAPAGKPLDVAALFALADLAAVPRAGRTIRDSRFGTLHQVVAETGTRKLHVRMVAPGGNIRDAKPVLFDVAKVLAEIRAKATR